MGPIVILDKSTFQSLSKREHLFLRKHFKENLTPILGLELLGDLRKETHGSKTAEEKVTELAEKFGGSGPVTNVDYRTLCVESLLGNHFPLDGRIIPQSARSVQDAEGGWGVVINLSPLNQAILRWRRGEFEEFEREFAAFWREATRNFDFDSFRDQLNVHHVILPKVYNFTELKETVGRLLATPTHQDVWLSWLLDQLSVSEEYEIAIRARWNGSPSVLLKDFSPYSWHCLRVLLMLLVGTRHRLLRWQPTNLLDAQYLYYLPFCMVFISGDRLHHDLAPLLVRDDQSFVVGEELKADLKRLSEFSDSLSEAERNKLAYALGFHPPPKKDSVVHQLWKKYMRPWRPRVGYRITSLSEAECEEAIRMVEKMFRDVEEDSYFE